MTPTKPRKATQISTQMWDKLLQAARVYAGLFDYRAAAIRIGKNEGWTESELVEVGVIEKLSEAEQEKFNHRFKEYPILSASGIRETPRNDPTAQIIEHAAPDELEQTDTTNPRHAPASEIICVCPYCANQRKRRGQKPPKPDEVNCDCAHCIGFKQKAAPESRSLERGQEEPEGKGSGKEPSGATD